MSEEKEKPQDAAPPKPTSGMRRKLALLIMAGVILVQGGVAGAYFLLYAQDKGSVPAVPPNPEEVHADGHGDDHADHHGDAHGGHEAHADDAHGHDAHAEPAEEHGDAHGGHGAAPGPGQVEVDLGEFSVSSYQAERGRTLFVSFHLYALLPSARERTMTSQFEAQKHRIREKVLVLFRGATLAELSEPELGSLKGQTLETLNACFTKPLLEEVMFSDFVIVEQ